ncbi:hypothetical protein EXU57_08840 [Segetibacter sp. 3557_3]|uniref:hypothetical protein n=1 Tax=Segetibacter sp. 3557_3 TaxID=2547429 RepID=UPI00105914B0|nr:hypothetical protein [Segetibacter sp. 3557_3]TDH26902.1 hypothetical protein EXU57_08840 [Segetibacter sp. 3557_3]
MTLPADIKETFFETLYGDKSVLDFEQWLYADKRLESALLAEDYLDLISYGYKGDRVKYGLYKLLEKHIDKGEYEKWKLLKLLRKALKRDNDLPEILRRFYDLYCKGYGFLDNLGLGYGLAVEVPPQADSWEELTAEQQQKLLNSFYPEIEYEIKKAISWLESDKVVLTGFQDEYYHYEYIDNRTEDEKQPTGYKVEATVSTNVTEKYRNDNDAREQKPWWKFW